MIYRVSKEEESVSQPAFSLSENFEESIRIVLWMNCNLFLDMLSISWIFPNHAFTSAMELADCYGVFSTSIESIAGKERDFPRHYYFLCCRRLLFW